MKTLQEIKLTLSNNKQHLFAGYPIKSMAILVHLLEKEQDDKSDLK